LIVGRRPGTFAESRGMPNKLRVSLRRGAAMSVTRLGVEEQRLVYVIVVAKPIKYRWASSKIAYIGTTQRGVNRVATSAAQKAPDLLGRHGISSLEVRILTCTPRQRVKTWHKLERSLLLVFRQIYGEVPLGNTQGSRIAERDEFQYFQRSRIEQVIADLSS
jgi:hypothetical protein